MINSHLCKALGMSIPMTLLIAATTSAAAHELTYAAEKVQQQDLSEAIEQLREAAGHDPERLVVPFAFIAAKTRWDRSPVSVCYWNGSDQERREVTRVANEWLTDAMMEFSWGTDQALNVCTESNFVLFDIRVSLEEATGLVSSGADQAWSLYGRQASTSTDKVTVNLPRQVIEGSPRNYILHEFGHALGFLHEHQREECTGQFDDERIRVFFRARGKTEDEIDEILLNMKAIPDSDPLQPAAIGELDISSVMMYRIPTDFFTDNEPTTCKQEVRPTKLSTLDLDAVKLFYSDDWMESFGLPTALSDLDITIEGLVANANALDTAARNLRAGVRERREEIRPFGGPEAAVTEELTELSVRALSAEVRAADLRRRARLLDMTPEVRSHLATVLELLEEQ